MFVNACKRSHNTTSCFSILSWSYPLCFLALSAAKTFARRGYYVFINQDAESRIRDGHNYDQIRISNDLVLAEADKVRY